MRYARQAPTRVRLSYLDDGLDLQIEDDGPAAHVPAATGRQSTAGSANGGGHGLAGLTERAEILGGRLQAGPRAGGGFAVRAWLPVSQ